MLSLECFQPLSQESRWYTSAIERFYVCLKLKVWLLNSYIQHFYLAWFRSVSLSTKKGLHPRRRSIFSLLPSYNITHLGDCVYHGQYPWVRETRCRKALQGEKLMGKELGSFVVSHLLHPLLAGYVYLETN